MNLWLSLLQGSLVLLLFGGLAMVLRQRASTSFRRWYLLTTLLLSLSPFAGKWLASPLPSAGIVIELPEINPVEPQLAVGHVPQQIPWLYWLYITGIFLSLLPFAASVLRVGLWLLQSKIEKNNGLWLVRTQSNSHGICSFGPFVFLSANEPINDAFLLHEKSHINRLHSLDKLLMQVVISLFWFNPIVYIIRRELHLLHEIQADADVCKQYAAYDYANQLSAYSLGVPASTLLNPLFKSQNQLLTRIIMLNKTIKPIQTPWLVLLLGLSILIGCGQHFVENEVLAPIDLTAEEVLESSTPMPEFPGGDEALIQYMSEKVRYPAAAKDQGIEGIVIIQFVVDRQGKVRNAQVLRGVHPDLDAVSLEAVERMPDWQPAIEDEKAVNVLYNLPFRFRLPEPSAE
ncbi:MAG: TonB family protein [Bacteroidia bacterium]